MLVAVTDTLHSSHMKTKCFEVNPSQISRQYIRNDGGMMGSSDISAVSTKGWALTGNLVLRVVIWMIWKFDSNDVVAHRLVTQ